MRWQAAVVFVLFVAGCLGAPAPTALQAGSFETTSDVLTFGEPVQVNGGSAEGFEPSLRIAPDGTIYVAAARGFLAGSDGSAASPVWFSKDAGGTWARLPSMLSLRERVKTVEGDLAVDAQGNVYFVDTYLVDNAITVWGPDQEWRSTRPVQGTIALDDRPWLAAHGDGVLYYVGNSIGTLPAPDHPAEPFEASRIWFYRSVDGGTTWTPGHAFTGASYCHIAASPADSQTVAAVCTPNRGGGIGLSEGVTAYTSADRGATWSAALLGSIVPAQGATDANFASVSFDPKGVAYAFWIDEGSPSRLHLSEWGDGEWNDIATPAIDVRAANPWVAAGPDGVGLVYYGKVETEWSVHAWILRDGHWNHWVDPSPVSREIEAPEDFFQAAMDARGRLHIAFQRDLEPATVPVLAPFLQPVFHVAELG